MEERHATLHVLPAPAPAPVRPQPRPAGGPEHPVRVHVVATDPLARVGITTLLSGHPGIRVTGESTPGPHLATALHGPRPHVLVVHGPLSADQHHMLARAAGDDVKTVVLGAAPPARAPAGVHGELPGTASAGQLAAAVILAAAGYAFAPAPPHGPPPPLSPVRPDELTQREAEVLHLLARGLSNGEIAQTLSLSQHTVKTHVQNMLHKLRLRNRVHAAIYAFETGVRRAPHPAPGVPRH
ncbi:response regulator transcription factor [Streptomyces sp. NPDC048219]|uniref:helix-turn-helix transcriptional regulator n=1 Tax=unclassified Streptomyces TaxID=2593676 RepID=UPI00341259CA